MNITLIYPGITEGGFNNLKGNEGSWMNHGLCSLSSVLKSNGHKVSLIDLRMLLGWDHFAELVGKSQDSIFGVTVMSVDLNTANACAQIIKNVSPGKKVVYGGAHPSIAPDEILKNANVDHLICGEGEISFLELVNDIAANRPVERMISGKQPDLDVLPFADRELFSLREEPFVKFLNPPFVTIIAGRGCVYNCNYCQPAEKKIFGHKVRRRSVTNVVSELKELQDKFGFNSFMFHDDCLTENKQWIEDFCAEYLKVLPKKQFVCQSRADLVCKNPQVIKLLKDIGLELMIIGFESGSQRMLDFIGKGTKPAQNFEAAAICHKLGIKIWANYMLGLPGETKQEQKMTLNMIKKIRPYHCSPAYYTPHPGSRLFDYCHEKGLSLIKKSEDYRRNTYEPKIKGIDYDYLKRVLYASISYGQDQNSDYGVRKVANFLRREGVPIRMPKILSFNRLRNKTITTGTRLKSKLISLTNLGEYKSMELLSRISVSDPSIVFVNMNDVKYVSNAWSSRSVTNDAQVYLYDNPAQPLDTREYSRIQFYLYSDSPVLGHFTWWLVDGRWQSAKHFHIQKGWKKYVFNLKEIPTYGASYGSDIAWEGLVSKFRLDPSEKEGVLTRIKKVKILTPFFK